MRWVSGNLNPSGLVGEYPSIVNRPLRVLEISLLQMLPDKVHSTVGWDLLTAGLVQPQLDSGCLCSIVGFALFGFFQVEMSNLRVCRALSCCWGAVKH